MNLIDNLPEQFNSNPALDQKRKVAVAEYQKNGFPDSTLEEWKYTDPSIIAKSDFPLLAANGETTEFSPEENQIIIENGFFNSKGQLPASIICTTFNEALQHKGAHLATIERHIAEHASLSETFVALNTALFKDALIIIIPENTVVEKPIEILNISTETSSEKTILPRILVVAGRNSEFTIIEKMQAGSTVNRNFINAVLEFAVAEDARVSHYRVQNESTESLLVSTIAATLAEKANFRTHTFSFGAKLARNHVNVVLNGKDCDVTMNGLTAISGTQHVDNQTLLDNAEPNCQSLELYKGIYADSSEGVFSGSIIVRPDAQKTNAIQSNRSLLLSDKASVNTKPQLKIWADDVKCTHGATIGQLDENAMFYLKSRGISDKDARVMLIHAFASEIVSSVSVPSLKEELEQLLLAKLHL